MASYSCSNVMNGGHYSLEDRKSTRLNSSHQIISYAVFCLKKKKNVLAKNTQITDAPCLYSIYQLPDDHVNVYRFAQQLGQSACTNAPFFFFFNDTATTEIYTLSLHDALPIWVSRAVKEITKCDKLNVAALGN